MKLNNLFKIFFVSILLLHSSVYFSQKYNPVPKHFQELPDPTADVLSDWSNVKTGLQASFVSIDERHKKSVAPNVLPQNTWKIVGWKGERLSAQIILWTTKDIPSVRVDISNFTNNETYDLLDKNISSARFVRYVMTDEFAEGCGHRKPENFASSLSPDMLDDISTIKLEAKNVRPVWITVDVPRDAKKGNYKALVYIVGEKKQDTRILSLELEVIDKILPKPTEWSYHLDLWQHPSSVAMIQGLDMWSDEHFEAMKPTMQMLANAGQKVITTTLNKDPWNVQTYHPYADMITWHKQKNGKWKYDYHIFDKWVQFMMDLGINKMINCYSIVPWNNEIHYIDEKTGELVNVIAKPGTPVFEELWTTFLEDFVKHLDKKGWLYITNIALDERSREEMDNAFALLKKIAPKLGVSYADNQKTYQRYPKSRDISIAIGHPFSEQDILNRKKMGLNTTFYICCSDAFPNVFTFSDPAEATFLAWYAEATNFDGMLRWSFNSWVENPMQDSRFRTWPAGDTYLVYPYGRSSIRYERILEGVQDYEKIQIIKQILKTKNDGNMQKLQEAINKLKITKRTNDWNENLNKAKQLLNDLSRNL